MVENTKLDGFFSCNRSHIGSVHWIKTLHSNWMVVNSNPTSCSARLWDSSFDVRLLMTYGLKLFKSNDELMVSGVVSSSVGQSKTWGSKMVIKKAKNILNAVENSIVF